MFQLPWVLTPEDRLSDLDARRIGPWVARVTLHSGSAVNTWPRPRVRPDHVRHVLLLQGTKTVILNLAGSISHIMEVQTLAVLDRSLQDGS